MFDATDSPEEFANLGGLPLELQGVWNVLIGAAPASFKVFAAGTKALRRRCFNGEEARLAKALLPPDHLYPDLFAGKGEGHKKNHSFNPTNSGPTVCDALDAEGKLRSSLKVSRKLLFSVSLGASVGPHGIREVAP